MKQSKSCDYVWEEKAVSWRKMQCFAHLKQGVDEDYEVAMGVVRRGGRAWNGEGTWIWSVPNLRLPSCCIG